jgi:hypothetical protein
MKFSRLYYYLFVFSFLACNSDKVENQSGSTGDNNEQEEISYKQDSVARANFLADSIVNLQIRINDSILTAFNPKVLSYQGRWDFTTDKIISTFIPLSDEFLFRWSDHPDSLVIDSIYLQKNDGNRNYHVLSKEKRALVLSQTQILENDSIFIFNLKLDSIVGFRVKDVPLIAMLSPYANDRKPRAYDFQFGFEFKSKPLNEAEYSYIFVTTCAINPFVKGGIKPIKWEKMDSTRFPKTEMNKWDSAYVKRTHPLQYFHYIDGELEYMVQNRGRDSVAGGRKVVVISTKSNDVLFSGVFQDRESTSLLPLNGIESHYSDNSFDFNFQQTGLLFKNKPPVIYGFLGYSFGCPGMSYIGSQGLEGSEVKGLRIHCDNRH